MKNRNTLVFFAVVIGLALYTYFGEYKRDLDLARKKSDESSLVNFKVDQVNFISIQNSKEHIQLERTTDGWNMTSPVQDQADDEAIDGVAKGLTLEKSLEVAKEGEKIDWNEYGLDKPEGKVQIKNQEGQEIVIEVSAKKNFEGNSLIRKQSQNQVLVASSNWQTLIQKPAFEFRRKNILRERVSQVDKFLFRNSKGDLEFEFKDGNWTLSRKPKLRLDQNKVRILLAALNETKATDFLVEGPGAAADLKKYSLDRPQILFKTDLKGKTWTLEMTQDQDKFVYARTSDPSRIVRLDVSAIDKFNQISETQIQDYSFPFLFKKNEVAEVNLQDPLKKMTFKQRNENWELEPANPQVAVQQPQFRTVIEKVMQIQGVKYVEKPKDYQAKYFLSFKDKTSGSVFQMEWNHAQKMKIDSIESSYHIVKTNLSDNYVVVEESAIGGLGLNELSHPLATGTPAPEPMKEKNQ